MDKDLSSMETKILKEGFLYKRAEYWKTWRGRYFYLFSDGNFIGYKQRPLEGPKDSCYNIFDVRNSKVISTEIPKPNSFLVRCYQCTRYVDRLFKCDSKENRDDWVAKLKSISDLSKGDYLQGSQVVQTDEKVIGNYKMLYLLGQGSFGKVVLAQHSINGKYVAIKVMNKESILEKEELSHIQSEKKVMKTFNHPFLVSLIEFLQTKDRIYFVMEYLNGGELYYHLRISRKFSENRTRLYAAEIILALQFLHTYRVTYRDLKLENTILDAQGHVKLCDFGLCKDNTNFDDRLMTFCGTREYLAPEIIMENAYGYCIDWWCLGVLLFESLTGDLPFKSSGENEDILYERILYTPVNFRHYKLSDSYKELITGLLIKEPSARLGCKEPDGEDIKLSPVFADLNWDDVYDKKVQPEFVPELTGPGDTKYVNRKMLKTEITFSPPTMKVEFDFDM